MNKHSGRQSEKGRLSLFLLFIAMSSLLALSACAWFETKAEKSAEMLAGEGMEAFEKEKYRKAIESFEQLRDWYPFSKYAILAELKIADSYYHLNEYEEAVFAYEEFENLHPRNDAIPYVIYQIGQCYFEQIDTVDRDQSVTRKALETFGRLATQFPGDTYSKTAETRIRECKKVLAEHEFYVGVFYYRTKHYKAALTRFERVISNYPDMENIQQDARRYIALCKSELAAEE